MYSVYSSSRAIYTEIESIDGNPRKVGRFGILSTYVDGFYVLRVEHQAQRPGLNYTKRIRGNT